MAHRLDLACRAPASSPQCCRGQTVPHMASALGHTPCVVPAPGSSGPVLHMVLIPTVRCMCPSLAGVGSACSVAAAPARLCCMHCLFWLLWDLRHTVWVLDWLEQPPIRGSLGLIWPWAGPKPLFWLAR